MSSAKNWHDLNQQIVDCTRCPRLVEHCRAVAREKRRAYRNFVYWGRPVPNLGPANAKLLIVGLAPGAHGANRTGRMFTGDRSGDWLFRALHRAGFCNQSKSLTIDDGLKLKQCAITAVCHCAPPANKPTAEEILTCRDWYNTSVAILKPKVFVALGQIGWNLVLRHAKENDWYVGKRPLFGHTQVVELTDRRWLIGSYHPSQQNTFTGRLTEAMLDSVFDIARQKLDDVQSGSLDSCDLPR